jgi:hypothetical protein
VQIVLELAPVIGTIISAHCPGTRVSEEFMRACVHGHWDEATALVEGMLAEPWHLKGYQETRLHEFLALLEAHGGNRVKTLSGADSGLLDQELTVNGWAGSDAGI